MTKIIELLENGTISEDDIIEFSGGFLNKLISKLGRAGIELHYKSPFTGKKHNFTGPGTQLQNRLSNYLEIRARETDTPIPREDSIPVNKADEAAMFHDVCYMEHKDKESRSQCDNDMIERLKLARKDPNEAFKDKLDAGLIEGLMRAKRFLGLGYDLNKADLSYIRDILP
jgi:hypothetical protein